MRLLLHHPHHDHHHGKPFHHKGKKGHKIMKKMAKLEKKLSKYNFDSSSSEDSCSSDAASNNFRSRSLSKSHKRRKGRSHLHRRHHGRGFGSRGRSSSSSSSSASESSGSSSSSSSSRSPSPCDRRFYGRHHHQHGPPGHLSRSKSFAGRDNRSPSPFSRGPHQQHHHRHHPHHPPHHRGRFWRHQYRRFQDGLQGVFAMLAPESEVCNVREKSPGAPPTAPADQADLMDLGSPSRSVSRERETQIPVEVDQDIQIVEQEAAEQGQSVEGPSIDDTLAENWTKILREGLPSDARKDLLKKYPVSKSCSSLKGPQLNRELLPVASEIGLKIDNVQMHQQNQIGAGLTALGKAITDLNNKTELKKDQQVIDVLEELNEAAVIIADAHHSMTKVRQGLVQSELNKRVRPVVDNCEHDEFLYGKDLEKKIENVKGFGKYKKANKKHEREGRGGKGEKRKQNDQDGGRRCKHSNFHGGAKVH